LHFRSNREDAKDRKCNAFFFARLKERIRTPEQNFSAGKFCEAVPRARASDGERETRGRIPPSPPLTISD
jgi:hypothetical protein